MHYRIVCMCVLSLWRAAPIAAAEVHVGSVQQDIRTVVAALATRDADLANLEICVTETHAHLNAGDKSLSPISRRLRTIRRLGDRPFLSGITYDNKNNSMAVAEFAANWDGHRAKAYTEWKGGPDAGIRSGQIRDSEMTILQQMRYTRLLGLRMTGTAMTLPQWLEWSVAAKVKMSVTEEVVGKAKGIRVDVGDPRMPTVTRTFWLDGEKGFLPMKYR